MDEQQTNQTTDTTAEESIKPTEAVAQPPEVSQTALEVGSATQGEHEDAATAAASSGSDASAPIANVSDADPNVNSQTSAHQWTPEQIAQIQAIGAAPIPMQSHFDSALSAAEQFASDTQSSVSTALQSAGTRAINASESLAKEALASLQRLRDHL